jgi:hypothetical protein
MISARGTILVQLRARLSRVRNYALAAIAVLLVCLPLLSQTTQGTIQGTVTDQSGGVIAGATVTAIDVARGVTRALITDGAGEYVATNLTPGTYTVRAEAKGFRTVEHSGVLVEVGQNIRVDLVIQPGEQTQTITVTGEVPAIDTTDATLGGTVSNESINALPLNGRNFQRLEQLRPGVVTPVGTGTGQGQSTNGRRTQSDMLRLEGIAGIGQSTGSNLLNTSYRAGDTASLVPIDAIQEFSAEQNPKAEYGFRDGGQVNVGVKAGTNSIHGTAYAFGRDAAATDAPNYFPGNNPGGVTPATMEQFGATAGGRIIKDKLFWFASFEGLRVLTGDVNQLTMPTSVAMAPGADPQNELSFVDACNALNPTHLALGAAGNPINPLSAQLAGLNAQTCAVSPASSSVENVFPNNPNPANDFFSPGLTSNGPLNNGLLKIDYNVGPHQHLNGLYYRSGSSQTVNFLAGQTSPQWLDNVPQNSYQYSGDWTWTPNSTLVNDLRLGYVYINFATYPGDVNTPAGSPYPGGYGIPTGVTVPLYGGFPYITFSSFTGILGSGNRTSTRGPEGDVDLVESVSYLRGKHSFKFGFEYLYNIADGISFSLTQGNVAFLNLQDYLQGFPENWTILLGSLQANTQNAHSRWYGGFVQDDWRIRPRVMLNLGLRYEYAGPPSAQDNNISTYNLNATGNTPAIEQVGPGLPISRMYNGDYKDFAPRLGVAWDVTGNGRTVIRAAAGILMNPPPMTPFVPSNPFGANFPSIGVNTSGTAISALNSVAPGASCTNSSPVCGTFNWNGNPIFPGNQTTTINGVSYSGFSCTPNTGPFSSALFGPCPVIGVDPNFKQPYSAQWNLDIQRAITNALTLDVAYVGNHGFREEASVDLNQPAIGAGWDATAINSCLGSAATNYNKCKPDATAEVGQYTAQFPYINNIDSATNGEFSNYDALQVTAQGRAYHGLSFLAGYTYAHALGESSMSSIQAGGAVVPSEKTDLRLNYGSLNTDLRHRFTFSPTYNIPGMKSPGEMLEGWSLSAILVVQSGLAWNPSDTKSTDWLGEGENISSGNSSGITQYWNYDGPRSAFSNTGPTPIPCYNGPNGKESGCTSFAATPAAILSACQTAAQAPYAGNAQLQQLSLAALANSTCYTQGGGYLTPPAYGTLGNAGSGIFTGPVYRNVDFSVAKLWKLKERYSAQFRAEFFNLFNRADFNAPGTDPSKGLNGGFGYATSTPDSTNPVLGSGGPRHVQFGLKLTF